jgi:hypothetical protein
MKKFGQVKFGELVEETTNGYNIFVEGIEEKLLGRPRPRW